MTVNHRRPMVAFVAVTLLCAFVLVNGFLALTSSPVGNGLAGAQSFFKGLEGAEDAQLMPEVVDGAALLEEPQPEAPSGTTTQVRVPALDAVGDLARTTVVPTGPLDPSVTGGTAGAGAVTTSQPRESRTGRARDGGQGVGATRDRSERGTRSPGTVSGRVGGGTSPEPRPTTDGPGNGPKSGTTPPGHAATPARPTHVPPGQARKAQQPSPAKDHSAPGHDRVPPGQAKQANGTPPTRSQGSKGKPTTSPGKAKGHSKPTGPRKAKGHGHR